MEVLLAYKSNYNMVLGGIFHNICMVVVLVLVIVVEIEVELILVEVEMEVELILVEVELILVEMEVELILEDSLHKHIHFCTHSNPYFGNYNIHLPIYHTLTFYKDSNTPQ
ncbi:hypothetical protein NC653_015401 [Populus alba x Populus x berolinensis]|uniref:Uncharacterized protein n=1 Tax=Populus alba x Populus x berolinensis TaxID=444605 RepID=A0AAD6QKC7_9ROSI|nr:hypothetical protein NC653_015401 [Populus alba x Populus x berolinensis]